VTTRKSNLLILALSLLLLAGLFPSSAAARDRGFKAVVHEVCTTYHARQNYRFVGWLAGMATKVARPEGVKSMRMAIFEDQHFTARDNDEEFENAVENALQENWKPLVRVRSRRDGERTSIYGRESGNDVSMFIITIEQTEAVVIEVKMSAAKFAQMMDDPDSISASMRDNSRDQSPRIASEDLPGHPPALQRRDDDSPANP
jgi:Domain of unknown function (DUF4252)